MTNLRLCDGCSRHVFASEKACPFCSATLESAPKRSFGARLRKGMSRAQVLAVAAAVTGPALFGCTDTPHDSTGHYSGGSSGTTAGTDSSSGGSGGSSSGGSGGASASGGSGGTAGTVSGGAGGMMGGSGGDDIGQPVYGAPIPDDAGTDAGPEPDAATDVDASSDEGGGMAIPLYGASPAPR